MGPAKLSLKLSLSLWVVWMSVAMLAIGASASTPVRVDTESELESLRRRADIYRTELEQGTGDSGTPALLLNTLENIKRLLSSQGASEPAGADRERAALGEEMTRVARAWMELQPFEVGAYLAVLRHGESGPDPSLVEQICERFGSHLPTLQSTASELRNMGQGRLAEDLLQGYVDDHPESPEAYLALMDHYERQKAESKVAGLARRWLARIPDDPRAQRYYLRYHHTELDEQEREILAEAILESVAVADDPQSICRDLEQGGDVRRAAACWQRLEDPVKGSKLGNHDHRALIRTAAAVGDAEALLRWVKGKGDSHLLSDICTQLAAFDQCDALGRFLNGSKLGSGGLAEVRNHHARLNIIQSMGRCGLNGAAEAALELFRNAQDDQLQYMVNATRLKGVPVDQLEQILLDRLYGDPQNVALQSTVAELYRQIGEPEKLLAHYLDWAAHDPSNGTAALNAAELLAAQGRLEASKTWIEEFLRRGSDEPSYFFRAIETLNRLGETDWAKEAAQEMSQSDDTSLAAEGYRLLLKIAGENGRREEILAHYRDLEAVGSTFRKDMEVYVAEMQAAGRLGEVVAEVERKAQKRQATGSSNGTLEAALGSEFAAVGLWSHSAAHYRRAIAMAPDDLDLRIGLAESLAELEQPAVTEKAYRDILELSPTHDQTLTKLGFLLQGREDFSAVVELLEPIAASGHRLDGSAGVLLGHAYLRLEAFDKAAEILTQTVSRRPDDNRAFLNLAIAWDGLDRPSDAEPAFREFLRLTAWSETRAGECNCSCGLPGQRALARKWLDEHGSGS